MFLEPNNKEGWIEVVCGSMFSGKTEELLRRIRRAEIANQRVCLFKPKLDTRYDEINVVSHNENAYPGCPIEHPAEIFEYINEHNCQVIAIDEAQFFDESLPDIVAQLALLGKRVIIAGLDMDYLGRPFGTMPQLLAIAEYVTKLHAVCMHCGQPASHSYRKPQVQDDDSLIALGEKDLYEARCRSCFHKGEEHKNWRAKHTPLHRPRVDAEVS